MTAERPRTVAEALMHFAEILGETEQVVRGLAHEITNRRRGQIDPKRVERVLIEVAVALYATRGGLHSMAAPGIALLRAQEAVRAAQADGAADGQAETDRAAADVG